MRRRAAGSKSEENKGDNIIPNTITTLMKTSGSILEGSEIRK